MKTHGENVQQRESRVHRYGNHNSMGLAGLQQHHDETGHPTYAMFNKKVTRNITHHAPGNSTELRRRHGQGSTSDPKYYAASPYGDVEPSSDTNDDTKTVQQQQKIKQSKSRQETATKIEKSVAEVPNYFKFLVLTSLHRWGNCFQK